MTRPEDEVLDLVMGTFLRSAAVKPKRAKPHRCLGCGKVTKHCFCPSTREACHRLYMDKRKEEK